MLAKRQAIILFLHLFGIILNKATAQSFEIWEAQGEAAVSPLLGQAVTLENNIVTARSNGFFVIQTPPERADGNPLTSDAIVVADAFFGQPGAVVTVSGTLQEEDGLTILAPPGLEIIPTGEAQPLPPPVVLSTDLPSPVYTPLHSLERLEGMRVSFEAYANGPSTASELVPLRIDAERVLREPGIQAPGLPELPEWDGNPEIFWIDPNGLNAPNNRFINTNAAISATGVLIEADPNFWVVLPEAYTVLPGPEPTPVPPKAPDEFTLGSLNALFLFADAADAETRYRKLARYIDEQMRLPDILAVQEVGSLTSLNNLAFYIEQQNPSADYDAYLLTSNQDLKLGYLVKSGLSSNLTVAQLGATEVFTFSGGLLHDRPPLLLTIALPTNPPTQLQVLNLHVRSLLGIEGSSAAFVRNKRHQQAISIATMVEALRANGNLVVLGDFNAFQFTDGYVDVLNQIAGLPSLGAQFPPLGIVDAPLTNELQSLPEEQRYSYVFNGSAQALDHCLTANLQELTSNGMFYARGNADYALAYAGTASSPLSASDHDGLVLYLQAEHPVSTGAVAKTGSLELTAPNPIRPGQWVEIKGAQDIRELRLVDATGRPVARQSLNAAQVSWAWPEVPAGFYSLQLRQAGGMVKAFKFVAQ